MSRLDTLYSFIPGLEERGWKDPTIAIVRGSLTFNRHYDSACVIICPALQTGLIVGDVVGTPSREYKDNPLNPRGTPFLDDGFYPDAWTAGLHKGRKALIQATALPLIRYNGGFGDSKLEGIVGLNFHDYGGKDGPERNPKKASAGCIVPRYSVVVSAMYELCLNYGTRCNIVMLTDPAILSNLKGVRTA